MPTGACGINCDICKLNLLGTCSSCGPGTSSQAEQKLAAQQRLLGGTCAILACAHLNQVGYCLRDCSQFPCDNFSQGPYPYSSGYLQMQDRRRRQNPPAFAPDKSPVEVPPHFWDGLQNKNLNTLCNWTLFRLASAKQMVFQFLNEEVLVDVAERCLKRASGSGWERTDDPLLELVTLLYLNNVKQLYPLGREIVGVKDLKEAHFFQGPHVLQTDPLLQRYGQDIRGFEEAARFLDGRSMDMADAAYELFPFPRVPLYFLFWKGDAEFEPRISVLFDRSIEALFSADAIWGLVGRVSTALLQGPR
ncbi:MAG: DUF3786 domain-containing protein [Desulfobacterales bacterium]|jgi:hypothetical protein|nr:DUF3786 domain-containing protein [Deltaproteobacteria bacterium]